MGRIETSLGGREFVSCLINEPQQSAISKNSVCRTVPDTKDLLTIDRLYFRSKKGLAWLSCTWFVICSAICSDPLKTLLDAVLYI